MTRRETGIFLIVAGFPDSIVTFRGPLIDALCAKGLQVHVAAPGLSGDSPVRRQLDARGVVVHDIPLRRTGMSPWADMVTLVHLYRLMRAIRPGYFLGYTIKPVIYGSLAAWMARVPCRFALITGLGYAFRSQRTTGRQALLHSLVKRLYGLALRVVEKVFFQNPDDEAVFRAEGIMGARTRSFVVNGSGVDVREYAPAPVPDGPRFLLIARLLGDKGVREYAQAAKRIRAQRPDVVFSLVGWIDDSPDAIGRPELDAWVAEGALNYAGRLDDVRPAIAGCSVYVLPSYHEGTPRTVLEAMAMGRAIITTDAPGCRETVEDGHNGYLVPVKSVAALVEAMQRFIDDPGLAARMGDSSRIVAVEKYDVGRVNAILLRQMGIQ
jgi:glycosyltransferase involved in cell wall biosynthesis